MNISEIMAETGSIIVGRDAHSRIIVRSKQDGSICTTAWNGLRAAMQESGTCTWTQQFARRASRRRMNPVSDTHKPPRCIPHVLRGFACTERPFRTSGCKAVSLSCSECCRTMDRRNGHDRTKNGIMLLH